MAVIKTGVPRFGLSYLTKDETLVNLTWELGDENFIVGVGSDQEFEIPTLVSPDNAYLPIAVMIDWLDRWIEDNDEEDDNVVSITLNSQLKEVINEVE